MPISTCSRVLGKGTCVPLPFNLARLGTAWPPSDRFLGCCIASSGVAVLINDHHHVGCSPATLRPSLLGEHANVLAVLGLGYVVGC